ncbi:MAG: hypothetical protein ABEK10_02350 [Candidatus Nanosalina sp.]
MKERKGQYMAVEAVLSLGLSLIVAVAAIGVFGTYRDSVLDAIEERNVEIASSEILTAIYNLGAMGDGSSISVELPETGNRDYTVSLDQDSLDISSAGSSYSYSLESVAWASDFRGSVEGNQLSLVRVNGNVEVRSG